jgi:hypothetical protein
MPTNLRSETARANGAKSRGPKTAEGIAKSSRNSLVHGLSGRNIVVLECENPDDFWLVLNEQMEIHQPATPAEKDLVDQMVAARWRLRRIRSIETAILDAEMIRQKPELAQKFAHCDAGIELAHAFCAMADNSRALALASRYEARLYRMHHSAYKILRELQEERRRQATPPAALEAKQPEPPPEPTNPPAPKPAVRNPISQMPSRAALPPVSKNLSRRTQAQPLTRTTQAIRPSINSKNRCNKAKNKLTADRASGDGPCITRASFRRTAELPLQSGFNHGRQDSLLRWNFCNLMRNPRGTSRSPIRTSPLVFLASLRLCEIRFLPLRIVHGFSVPPPCCI